VGRRWRAGGRCRAPAEEPRPESGSFARAGTPITASAGNIALLAGTTEPARPRIVAKTAPAPAAAAPQGDYVCPMDPEVRSPQPGKCSRCGMALVLGIPDQSEYPLELTTTPPVLRPGEKVRLRFTLRDPKSGAVVKNFEIMHERLFHMFIVSGDLQYFLHDHPVQQPDGSFVFDEVFPKPGMYRVVADVYPSAGTPQLIPRTLFVGEAVAMDAAALTPDNSLQHGENTDVSLTTDPARPVAGIKTHLFFKLGTADGLEKYLGAWAHMLISSDDTIDLIHEHPFIADGGPEMQFDILFPRARTYRVWVQFERKGVVNTIAVNIPVITLEQSAQ